MIKDTNNKVYKTTDKVQSVDIEENTYFINITLTNGSKYRYVYPLGEWLAKDLVKRNILEQT